MSEQKLPAGYVWLEVASGCAGPSLYISDDAGGYRLAGPKPWGGGVVMHRFKVNIAELKRELAAIEEPTNGQE